MKDLRELDIFKRIREVDIVLSIQIDLILGLQSGLI